MASSFFVSEADFKVFYQIDRTLYKRLVFSFHRDKDESKQVMAFWIWLERSRLARNLVHKMLSLQDGLINALVEEAILCLSFMKNDHFHFPLASTSNSHIQLTQNVTKSWLTIEFFYYNRVSVLRGVTTVLNEVCRRAFDDIDEQALKTNSNNSRSNVNTNANNTRKPFGYFSNPTALMYSNPTTGFYSNYARDGTNLGDNVFINRNEEMVETSKNKVTGVLGHLKIHNDDKEKRNLHVEVDNADAVDERTIFLTFSKGYPISENEVIDFFTRKYGDCIEAIHMQEIQRDEQPLHARLVIRSASTMQVVLDGKGKAKFSVNGKHLWARKYV